MISNCSAIAALSALAADSGRTITHSSRDQPVTVQGEEVAAVDVSVPDPRAEHQRDVPAVGRGDLALVAEVLKHPAGAAQDRGHHRPALVGREGHRRQEHGVGREQLLERGVITGLDGGAEGVHGREPDGIGAA